MPGQELPPYDHADLSATAPPVAPTETRRMIDPSATGPGEHPFSWHIAWATLIVVAAVLATLALIALAQR